MSDLPRGKNSGNKYRNQRTQCDGITFASKREAARYQELKLMQKAGAIRDLRLQTPFVLVEKSEHGRAVKYLADFTYTDCESGALVIEDAKGMQTPVYKLKKRLMAEKGYLIREV